MYNLSDYDYILPQELIAQSAAHPADSCKFLLYEKENDSVQDVIFSTLPQYATSGSLIVFNTTKVVKARIPIDFGDKQGEIFYLESITDKTCNALVRPGKKFRVGETLTIQPGVTCTINSISEEGRILTFSEPVDGLLERLGQLPLPPYISYNKEKEEDYQTVFAEHSGSVAAPTASLHFTDDVLDGLEKQGVKRAECILHVGLGTFKQVDVEDIKAYDIHGERAEVSIRLFDQIAHNKNDSLPVIGVGTTVTRTLESLPYLRASLDQEQKERCSQDAIKWRNSITTDITQQQIQDYIALFHETAQGRSFETTLYIIPGFTFRIIDELVTNFHLPKSSLLMLVAAFVGYNQMRTLYDHAITNEYRFYSFGDAMYLKQ